MLSPARAGTISVARGGVVCAVAVVVSADGRGATRVPGAA